MPLLTAIFAPSAPAPAGRPEPTRLWPNCRWNCFSLPRPLPL